MLDQWYEQIGAVLLTVSIGLIALRMVAAGLNRLADRTKTKKDDEFLDAVEDALKDASDAVPRVIPLPREEEDDGRRELRRLHEKLRRLAEKREPREPGES